MLRPGNDAQSIMEHVKGARLKIKVRPNAPKTEILGWDDEHSQLKIAVNAPPDKNKANQEILRFLSRLLKKKIRIISGSRSRTKVVEIL